jgi:hypothetical protein
MRPKKLAMRAFGSYADEATVDFTELLVASDRARERAQRRKN